MELRLQKGAIHLANVAHFAIFIFTNVDFIRDLGLANLKGFDAFRSLVVVIVPFIECLNQLPAVDLIDGFRRCVRPVLFPLDAFLKRSLYHAASSISCWFSSLSRSSFVIISQVLVLNSHSAVV